MILPSPDPQDQDWEDKSCKVHTYVSSVRSSDSAEDAGAYLTLSKNIYLKEYFKKLVFPYDMLYQS